MRLSGSSLTSNRDEKLGVRSCDGEVVVNDRKRRHDVIDEGLTAVPGFSFGQLHADLELGQRNCRNSDVVVVVDNVVETGIRPFCVNQEGRVEKQSAQNRSFETTSSRASRMAFIH